MDLLYLTEVQAYQSIRGPVYDKYAWDQQDKGKCNVALGVDATYNNDVFVDNYFE